MSAFILFICAVGNALPLWPYPIPDSDLNFLDFLGELSEASLDLVPLVGEKLSEDNLDLIRI